MNGLRTLSRRAYVGFFVAVLLGVVAGGVAATWVFPSTAFAATCTGPHYYTDAIGGTHNGVRVASPGMYTYHDNPPVCTHTSSLIAMGADGTYVEVGWIDAANGVPATDKPSCNFPGDGNPQAYRGHHDGVRFFCTPYGDISAPGWHIFNIDNEDGDFNWSFSMDGNYLGGTVMMDFPAGSSITNGERYFPGALATASFDGLQNRTVGQPWTAWTSVGCSFRNDPVYNESFNGLTWVVVDTSGTACPI